MKVLIAYSSRTGNTRRVAEALAKAAPEGSLLARVEDTPSADGFDVVFAGYWLDRGGPDAKAKEFLHSLHGKHVVLFETMGADPRSEHAYTGFANAGTELSPDNQIVGVFAGAGGGRSRTAGDDEENAGGQCASFGSNGANGEGGCKASQCRGS